MTDRRVVQAILVGMLIVAGLVFLNFVTEAYYPVTVALARYFFAAYGLFCVVVAIWKFGRCAQCYRGRDASIAE